MTDTTKKRIIIIGAGCGIALAALGVALAAEAKGDGPRPYPLATCIVSGEKLGEMGPPHTFTHLGREIRLCCKGCAGDFGREPDKFIKRLEAAGKAPGASGSQGQPGCGGCGH